jgi:hypothetical protein
MGAVFVVDPGDIRLVPPAKFRDTHVEDALQDWCHRHPELVNDGRPLISLGREVPTKHKHRIDNLYLDAAGGVIVAELKRGHAGTDINAQLLNYVGFAEALTPRDIEELCARNIGRTLASEFQRVFGTGVPKSLLSRRRFRLLAESFDQHIFDQCALLVGKGIDIACLRFSLYEVANSKLVHVEPVFGQIEDVAGPSIDDPYAIRCRWVFERLKPFVRNLASRYALELDESVSDYVYSFAPKSWPKCERRLYDRAFGVFFVWRFKEEEWFGVNFSYRSKPLPKIGPYLKRHKSILAKTFKCEVEEGASGESHYINLKLPEVGDLKALAKVEAALEKCVTAYLPVVTRYFAEEYEAR